MKNVFKRPFGSHVKRIRKFNPRTYYLKWQGRGDWDARIVGHVDNIRNGFRVINLPEGFKEDNQNTWKGKDYYHTVPQCLKCGTFITKVEKTNFEGHLDRCYNRDPNEDGTARHNFMILDFFSKKEEPGHVDLAVVGHRSDPADVRLLLNSYWESVHALCNLTCEVLVMCKKSIPQNNMEDIHTLNIVCGGHPMSLGTYCNNYGFDVISECLSDVIDAFKCHDILDSGVFACMLDESNDIALLEEIIHYCTHYVEKEFVRERDGKVFSGFDRLSVFLEIHQILDCGGKDIFEDFKNTYVQFFKKFSKLHSDLVTPSNVPKHHPMSVENTEPTEEQLREQGNMMDEVEEDEEEVEGEGEGKKKEDDITWSGWGIDSLADLEKEVKWENYIRTFCGGATIDGAANLQSDTKGFKHHFKNLCPQAWVIWCVCHKNSLFSADLKNDEDFKDVMDISKTLSRFFRKSPLRFEEMKRIFEFTTFDFQLSSYPSSSTTRWNQDVRQLDATWKNFEANLMYFEEAPKHKDSEFAESWILKSHDCKFRNDCKFFLRHLLDFGFMAYHCASLDLLGFINGFTDQLQAEKMTLFDATFLMKELREGLKNCCHVELEEEDGHFVITNWGGGVLNNFITRVQWSELDVEPKQYQETFTMKRDSGKSMIVMNYHNKKTFESNQVDLEDSLDTIVEKLTDVSSSLLSSFDRYFQDLSYADNLYIFTENFYRHTFSEVIKCNGDMSKIKCTVTQAGGIHLKELHQGLKNHKNYGSGQMYCDFKTLEREFLEMKRLILRKGMALMEEKGDEEPFYSFLLRGCRIAKLKNMEFMIKFREVNTPSSCEAERGFHRMKLTKNIQSNRMKPKKLNTRMNIAMNAPPLESFINSKIMMYTVLLVMKRSPRFFLKMERSGKLEDFVRLFDSKVVKGFLLSKL